MFRTVLTLSGLLFFAPGQAAPVLNASFQHASPQGLYVSGGEGDGEATKTQHPSGTASGVHSSAADPASLASAEHALSAELRYIQEYSRFAEKSRLPDRDIFLLAMTGFEKLQRLGKLTNERYLTIVDFRLPSNRERLWVMDMVEHKIVYRTLVAHGRNSGELYATTFSDEPQSYQSSLGFYLASETYTGKHGLSLRLDGLEPGINGNARDRAIVIHGADYVSQEFIQENGRLGRSQGCPALPLEVSDAIIRTIQGESCLFIYQAAPQYLQKSRLIREGRNAG